MFVSHQFFFFFLKKKFGTRLAPGRRSITQTVYTRVYQLLDPAAGSSEREVFTLREGALKTLPALLRTPTTRGTAAQSACGARSSPPLPSAAPQPGPAPAASPEAPARAHPASPPRRRFRGQGRPRAAQRSAVRPDRSLSAARSAGGTRIPAPAVPQAAAHPANRHARHVRTQRAQPARTHTRTHTRVCGHVRTETDACVHRAHRARAVPRA